MTPIDVANKCTWEQVKSALTYHYPQDYTQKFEEVYNKLKNADQTLKPELPEEKILLRIVQDEFEDDSWYDCSSNLFSLSYRPWNDIFCIPLDESVLTHYKYSEFVAHFLWEITWDGFDEEQVQKNAKHLAKLANDCIKSMNKCTKLLRNL